MSPPNAKKCYVPDCEYATTPGLPNYELVMKDLELHVKYAHMANTRVQADNQGGGSSKADKLPRPTMNEGLTESDCAHFIDKWNRYKCSALKGATQQYVTDQLWACCDQSLESAVYNSGINSDTTEDHLLKAIKKIAVRAQNTLVNVVKFLELGQDTEESVSSYTAHLKGQASVCNFAIKCKDSTCNKLTSYSDQMVCHQLVRGLADPTIQEQILSYAAENPDLDLNATLKYIEAKESGKRSSNMLSSSGGINRIAAHKVSKAPGTENHDKTEIADNRKCGWCGQ